MKPLPLTELKDLEVLPPELKGVWLKTMHKTKSTNYYYTQYEKEQLVSCCAIGALAHSLGIDRYEHHLIMDTLEVAFPTLMEKFHRVERIHADHPCEGRVLAIKYIEQNF